MLDRLAEVRGRGFEDLTFEVLGDLCAHLKDPSQGRLQGRDMKTVVHTWIEGRLVEAGADIGQTRDLARTGGRSTGSL